ncbi:uncharacterized protein LOC117552648 isoform X1 [Gymnodraco acuticeps]|uniref:Uncharacterized protein LOC117552648 isoform X1 n=1 Tax=Gymnodraco acuticeps TaxID=8218 RepID=A0A6P8UW68_GYMAC|nr:uncharacterized protein LOC117552648 isoform X1 [Gymnodraco acuticeps]
MENKETPRTPAPVTRDTNPDGPIEMENVDTRNAGPSNKPNINREEQFGMKCLAQEHNDMLTAVGLELAIPWFEDQCTNPLRHTPPRQHNSLMLGIKDTNLEEPDELYDSSSDISGSGDEFDSDSSLTKTLENIFFSINSDSTPPDSGPPGAEEPCTDAMTKSDGDTRYQTGRKRQSCHQMTFGDSGEKEQCSSQDTHESIVVAASQKKDGIRVYNKRQYCLYCSRPCAKMARHLEKVHEDKADVAKALSFPKRSKERRHQLDYIRNRGNYAHNAAVMESGNGELVPFKRPTQQAKGNEFIPCEYCLGLFNRKVLWRHIRTCKRKPVAQKPGENRVQSICTYTGPVPAQVPDAITERDGDTHYQTGRKRQSPADSLNVPACDYTVPDQMTFGDSGEKEQCSSQEDTHESIVVGASQKKNGIRVYNKRHYCLYCSRPCAKMARHLEKAHEDKADVAKALSFPKRSKERRHQLDYIRNRGNYAHNAVVMESGNGELVPFKRPTQQAKGNEFIPCKYCLGLFNRKVLWRHIRTCTRKPKSVAHKPGKNRVQSICTYTGPVPAQISKQLWGVICSMNADPITNIIKSDHVITDLGQDLLNKGGNSTKNQHNVREKMRELGRLIHNGRKVTSLKKLEDFINPKKYLEMVRAVKVTCGYDSGTATFQIPSLANKLGHALVKVSKLLKVQGLITNNHELVRKATEFQQVHSEKWNEMISSTALRNIAESKWHVPTLMPFTEDVQKMHQFLSAMQDECSSKLSGTPSTKSWTELAKVCLAQIILFNRRREGEVASMPLTAFLSRDTSDPHEDVDWALSEVEKKLCRHFSRIVIRGKRGRPVPILLTPKMLCALELLVKYREDCGVLKDNAYMFARPTAMTHFCGSDCIRGFAKTCGAKCPKSLTSTRLRKHAAILSPVLNMTDTEMDQLANFLGHDIRIPREFYRLPEKTLQLAKISKILMALEQGRLAEFHGKNLDEITIGPDERVLGSDDDEEEEGNGKIEEGNYASAVDEETILPTEGNTIPQNMKGPRLPTAEGQESSEVHAVRHASKGKAAQKRVPWTNTETQAVHRHMSRFITSCLVPGKSDCEKCLKAEPIALQHRDWQTLKFYVHNRITAYKRQIQRK